MSKICLLLLSSPSQTTPLHFWGSHSSKQRQQNLNWKWKNTNDDYGLCYFDMLVGFRQTPNPIILSTLARMISASQKESADRNKSPDQWCRSEKKCWSVVRIRKKVLITSADQKKVLITSADQKKSPDHECWPKKKSWSRVLTKKKVLITSADQKKSPDHECWSKKKWFQKVKQLSPLWGGAHIFQPKFW